MVLKLDAIAEMQRIDENLGGRTTEHLSDSLCVIGELIAVRGAQGLRREEGIFTFSGGESVGFIVNENERGLPQDEHQAKKCRIGKS